MKELELFLATTDHFTILPTIVLTDSEGAWTAAFEWLGFAAGFAAFR